MHFKAQRFWIICNKTFVLLLAYPQVKEIYNFTQDDLTTEDVLVLNCHNEIYVWLGCHANVGGKEQALDLAHVNTYFPETPMFFDLEA